MICMNPDGWCETCDLKKQCDEAIAQDEAKLKKKLKELQEGKNI